MPDIPDYPGGEMLIAKLLSGGAGRLDPPRSAERFVRLCEAHGVSSLILDQLRERGILGSAWTGILDQLEIRRRQWLARNIYLMERLREFHADLRRGGIPCIVLKGGSLLSVLYSDFGLRPLTDIDVLIRRRDLERAVELLDRAGWRIPDPKQMGFWTRTFYHLAVRTRDAFEAAFELHWDLEKASRHAIQLEELWERAVTYRLEGETLYRLSNEDLMVHLLLHLAHHYFNPRLIWVYDIQYLARVATVDWNRVLARAERWRLRLPVHYSLCYVDKMFPGRLPPEVLEGGRVSWFRRTILRAASTPHPLYLTFPLDRPLVRLPFSLYFIEKPGDIFRFLWRNIGPRIGWPGPGRGAGGRTDRSFRA